MNVHATKTRLSELLRRVEEKGESVRICRNGKPVAEIIPIRSDKKDPFIFLPELTVKCLEDPLLPLDDEEWPEAAR